MKKAYNLNKTENQTINELVEVYNSQTTHLKTFSGMLLSAIQQSTELTQHIHSIKNRLKDPNHLKEKLCRKLINAKKQKVKFEINKNNLLEKINDLVGVRILHIHTSQIKAIDSILKNIFDEYKFELIEGPFARTWDDENSKFFESCGITPQGSDSMYTSVHYIIASNSQNTATAEIQVRTLMEEVWGEVDHEINYPHSTNHLASKEQLRVLARITSSASRLVDSIFRCYEADKKTEK